MLTVLAFIAVFFIGIVVGAGALAAAVYAKLSGML